MSILSIDILAKGRCLFFCALLKNLWEGDRMTTVTIRSTELAGFVRAHKKYLDVYRQEKRGGDVDIFYNIIKGRKKMLGALKSSSLLLNSLLRVNTNRKNISYFKIGRYDQNFKQVLNRCSNSKN